LPGPSTRSDDEAITIALRALAHLAACDALSARFLSETGLSAGDVSAQAADPEFLAAVLDFFLSDDRALLDLAGRADLAPETVVAARAALPGGMLPHWT